MKRRILSFHIPLGHRYTIIAVQNSPKCCLEFTASAIIECFLACLVSSSLSGCRLVSEYLDNLGHLMNLHTDTDYFLEVWGGPSTYFYRYPHV